MRGEELSAFEERTIRRLEALRRVGEGRGILVGFSGGADSTALASVLSRIAGRERIVLAHVDHGMRAAEELAAERKIVQGNASGLGLELRVAELGRGRVEALARERGCGTEAAARSLRLGALEGLRREEGLSWIALAHNAQDQAETRIARFFQGSGPRGLKGIPERRGRILRPLLGAWREEIEDYLRALGLPWSEDSTNACGDYLRNRVRRELLPAVESVFPGWRTALGAGGERWAMAAALLSSLAGGMARAEGEGEAAIDAAAFGSAHPAVRLIALEDASALVDPGRRVPYRLLRQALRSEKAEGILASGAGLEISRSGDELRVRRRLVRSLKKGYFFRVDGPGRWSLPDGREILLREGRDPRRGPALSSLRFPALLRPAREGDEIAAREGMKKVSDLLSEWGAVGERRESLLVLEDSLGLACAFGGAIGFKNRYAERGWSAAGGDAYLELSVEGSATSDV